MRTECKHYGSAKTKNRFAKANKNGTVSKYFRRIVIFTAVVIAASAMILPATVS